jgi:DNA-directed RNA polymerase subunit RPC12/RpoP
MGKIRKYICQDCGNSWERMEGIGMLSIIYHCDKCGDQKMVEATSDYKEELGNCQCGGTYKLETMAAKCPECNSMNTSPEDDVVALWD